VNELSRECACFYLRSERKQEKAGIFGLMRLK
jgi:hypothetical protein